MADVDLIGALIAHLKAQAAISALVSTRVFGQELPGTESESMPRKALVLRYAGRGNSPVGANDYIRHDSIRLDVWHYGETFFQADRVRREVHQTMKSIGIPPVNQNSVRVHSASDVSGPIPITDPDTNWPIIIDSYSVFYSEAALG